MKRALTHDLGLADHTHRVVEVVAVGEEFGVAPGLTWRDCEDHVTADLWQWHDDVQVFALTFPPPPDTTESVTTAT
jgi:hypothetical protein